MQQFMDRFEIAMRNACDTGSQQAFVLENADSVAIYQGRVSKAGRQNLYSLQEKDIDNLARNVSSIKPNFAAGIAISAGKEELEGSFIAFCELDVSALAVKGEQIVIRPTGINALVMSAHQGDLPAVQRLLASGINLHQQTMGSPLMAAADNDQAAMVTFLLKRGARINDRSNRNGMTALHFAARKARLNTMKVLLRAGAKLEIADNDDYTPLWSAACSDNIEAIKLLLASGAKLQRLDKNGNNIVAAAAGNGANAAIQYLVQKGLNPRHANRYGRTALFDAIERQQPETVRLLLSYGLDANATTASGKTPLATAKILGAANIITMLEKAGARE